MRQGKKMAGFIFEILLLSLLGFSIIVLWDSSFIIDAVTTIFQNIYTVNTTGSSSRLTGPG